MSRKLILLNVLLAGVLVFAGVQFRGQWKAAKARDAAAAHPRVTPAPVPPLSKIEPAPPVAASKYADIAQKFLLDKSRNPNVPIEVPPPAPPPPPPPPPPPLPSFYGVMVLPSGPVAVLAADGSGSQGIHVGETIGQYKLTDIGQGALTFEWNGQTFVKRTDELGRREEPVQQAQAQAANGGRTVNAAPAPPPEPIKPGPGVETAYGIRVCNMGDGVAEGAVVDGYVKRVYTGPFGKTCGYERAK